jgi:hypothetical protein
MHSLNFVFKDYNKQVDDFLNEISHDAYLFKIENYMESAWIGHAPFLKFIIRELKPEIFVELGVHNGFSYFVGCQSIVECDLKTKAFAIDHWQGDHQAGFFDDSVYQGVFKNNEKYSEFSTLIKARFVEASETFKNGSIDLLHIDGLHEYESVKEDFNTWLPKMNENGVILMHDIYVRRNTFGVFKLWNEIKGNYKTIEFVGSHGLGIVFLGEVPFGNLRNLFNLYTSGYQKEVQGTFGSISDDVIQNFRLQGPNFMEINRVSAERNKAVIERNQAVAERDLVINSTTWKFSKPYRWIRSKF